MTLNIPRDEEEGLDLLGTVHQLHDAFGVRERVTKRFYERFQKEHRAFFGFIEGIRDPAQREWYASLMLNRLMFVYFIQKKGFLAGDEHYLRNRLTAMQARKRKGKSHTFYRYFLRALFHQGFATQPARRQLGGDLKELLGDVPYLSGGLFDVHQIEAQNPKIGIPDAAFERIFAFFDQYQWTLDARPLRHDRQINPDVLGYLFEQYINKKEMGAYYTKEDITDYIGRNTIIPCLFDEARRRCAVAFEPGSALWRLLQDSPGRYIHPAMRKGVLDGNGEVIPVPAEIEAGIEDVGRRGGWNRPAAPEYALPTETWREYVARRGRCLEVRQRLARGGVSEINDLITYNLDIRRFAEDAISSCEGPELLRAFYQALTGLTVLDPTCGSGAFLFGALHILEPLYEACLDRMRTFLADLERSGRRAPPEKFKDFRGVLTDAAQYRNAAYFIFKSIIVQNLYGVDIMAEAVEICKLRLFLKLVAQVDRAERIEPLPDLDFNLRAGNTLVGYLSLDEIRKAVERDRGGRKKLASADAEEDVARIEEAADAASRAYAQFRRQQTAFGGVVTARDKAEVRRRLSELATELDRYLAGDYRIDPYDARKFEAWRRSHAPFHWFAEFYGILREGGFDVVIGNPPYVEYSKVKKTYTIPEHYAPFATNLYCACCYRAHTLKRDSGRAAFIVPVSLPSTDRMEPLRELLRADSAVHYVSFGTRPSKLFEGAEQRLTIYLHGRSDKPALHSGGYLKWSARERPHLFALIEYVAVAPMDSRHRLWPKVRGPMEWQLLGRLLKFPSLGSRGFLGGKRRLYYKNTGLRYFNTVTLRPPKCWINGSLTASSRQTVLAVNEDYYHAVHALLLSTTFFLYYQATSNCRDLNPSDIRSAPVPALDRSLGDFVQLSQSIEDDYTRKGRILRMNNRLTGLVELESVTPARSKRLLDEIDCLLARHFGLTDEELDFVLNYDIKYRMGQDGGDERPGVPTA